jgi:hypothetical protein
VFSWKIKLLVVSLKGLVTLTQGEQFGCALQGRLRKDDAIVELSVDKSSERAAVTRGPKSGKLTVTSSLKS